MRSGGAVVCAAATPQTVAAARTNVWRRWRRSEVMFDFSILKTKKPLQVSAA
jgi:hypothetical protein